MGFDRSKYKATSMSVIQQQEQEHDLKRPNSGGEKNRITLKAGSTKLRIFPFHPDGGGKSYSEARCVSFLPVNTKSRDESGKVIEGKFEIKRRPVFNAKIHGDYKEDVVEAYFNIAKTKAIPEFTSDSNEYKKIMNKLSGMEGVKSKDSWVVYAAEVTGSGDEAQFGPVGLWEFGVTIKDQLRDKALEFVGDDITSPDPYSDPDEGICVIVNKTGKNLDTKYTVELDTVKTGKFGVNLVPTPIPDGVLETWSKMEPLYKANVGVYKRSDLELQLEGLERFDEKLAADGFPIRVFEREEFLEVVDRMMTEVPESEEGSEEEDQQQEEEKPKPKPKLRPAPEPKPRPVVKKAPVVVEEEPEEEEYYEEEVEEEVVAEEEVKLKSSNVADKLAEMRRKLKQGK